MRICHADRPSRALRHVRLAPAGIALLALFTTIAANGDDRSPRPHVAVAGFRPGANTDERDVWMAAAVEETLAWRLRRVPGIVAVPVVRAHQARRELSDDDQAPADWPRVARFLGTDLLLTGTCSGTPESASLELDLIEVNTGQARASTVASGRLFAVLDDATRWTLEQLGAPALDEAAHALVFAPPCRSTSALEFYAKAVTAARTGNGRDTIYFLTESLGYDRQFRPAIAMLAQAELRLPGPRSAAAARLHVLSELARRTYDALDHAEAELGHGLLLAFDGNYDAARGRYESALALSYERDEPYGQIAAVNNLCDLYLAMQPPAGIELTRAQREQFSKLTLRRAADWQQVALDLLAGLGDAVAETPAANKLALIHDRLGNKDESLRLHRRTLDAATRTGSRRNQASSWMFIGQWHRREQQWPDALDATSRCLALADPETRPAARVALASIYQAMGRPQDALSHYEVARDEFSQGTDLTNQFVCLREIALLRHELGHQAAALSALQEAIDIAHALELPDEPGLRERLQRWKTERTP